MNFPKKKVTHAHRYLNSEHQQYLHNSLKISQLPNLESHFHIQIKCFVTKAHAAYYYNPSSVKTFI